MYPLQWLRGLGALSVLAYHAYQHNRTGADSSWPLSGPAHQAMMGTELFVDMFFVLSGFVLWLPIARDGLEVRTGRPGRVLLFRRMARLLPLYATVVVVVWAVTNPSLPGHWQDLVLHLTFTHVYSDQYIFWTNGPAWSLAVEFHFYLLMALCVPLVHAGTRRVRSRAGRVLVLLGLPLVTGLAGLTFLGWHALIARTPSTDWSVWFSPLAKAPDFAIGMTLAVLTSCGFRLGSASRRIVGILGLTALVALVAARPGEGIPGQWWHPMYAVAIAAALMAVVTHDGPFSSWMSWRPLAWLGGLGYGVYLLHEPVMRLLDHLALLPAATPGWFFMVTTVLVGIPAVLLAWLSSRTIERAGLKLLASVDSHGRSRNYYEHIQRHD